MMNQIKQPMNRNSDIVYVNDIGFRLILIPFFGIAIPLITGMINAENFSNWEIKLSFLYTIGIAFVVWQGNRYLHFSLRSYFDWYNKPVKKIFAVLLTIFFYTIPAAVLMLVGWYRLFANGKTDWTVVFTSTLIILICVIFITHVYETVFLVKEFESEKVQRAQIEKAKAEAELEALKNQVDPHFIFNSLNTLSHLIEVKPDKAKLFNDHLADVFRYILHNKSRDLVLLSEEIEFIENYFSLLKIRFENAVQLKINVKKELTEETLVPPISLQVLIENAVKHNEFSDNDPLLVIIDSNKTELIVYNKIHKKALRKTSSKIGLQNLNDRYLLTTKRSIEIKAGEERFTVILPLLKID